MVDETVFRTNANAIFASATVGGLLVLSSVGFFLWILPSAWEPFEWGIIAGLCLLSTIVACCGIYGVWMVIHPITRPRELRLNSQGFTYRKGRQTTTLTWGGVDDIQVNNFSSSALGVGEVDIYPKTGAPCQYTHILILELVLKSWLGNCELTELPQPAEFLSLTPWNRPRLKRQKKGQQF